MAFFGPKPGVNPFGKMSIFPLFALLVFIAQKSFFPLQNMVKDIFLRYIATFYQRGSPMVLVKKWPFFQLFFLGNIGQLFRKMSIFSLFELLAFIAQKGVFALQNIVKDIFLPYILQKKKVEKIAIFGLKPWVNPIGKKKFFDFLNFLFLQPRKAFFHSRIAEKTFFWLIFPEKKVGKMAIFGPKPWVNPFGKMSIFRLFEHLVFIAQKGVFSFQNIIKDIFLGYIA